MPLTDQERRCLELACRYLDQAEGGTWAVREGPTLEEVYRDEPVPEGLISNGTRTAAVKVKR